MNKIGGFAALARRVTRRLASIEREQICCGSITLQQFDTLRALYQGGLTTGAIAERQGIDLSTASRNLAVLEKHGYLSRIRANADSRQVENRLTPKGKSSLQTLCCDEQAVYAAILERIPEAQRTKVLDGLQVLAEALDAGDSEPCCSTASS